MKIYINKDNGNIYWSEKGFMFAVPLSYNEMIDLEKDSCEVRPDDLDEWNEKEYIKVEKALNSN